jgi:hypothetical protein
LNRYAAVGLNPIELPQPDATEVFSRRPREQESAGRRSIFARKMFQLVLQILKAKVEVKRRCVLFDQSTGLAPVFI